MIEPQCNHTALRISGSVQHGLRKICLLCNQVTAEIPLKKFINKDMVVLYQLNKRKRYYEKANLFIREQFANSRDEALEKIRFIQFFEQDLEKHFNKRQRRSNGKTTKAKKAKTK